RLPLFESLPQAHDRNESVFERGLRFPYHVGLRLTEILPALAVGDDYSGASDRLQHVSRHLACNRAFAAPVEILSADRDVASTRLDHSRMEIRKRRTDDDVTISRAGHQRLECFKKDV